MNVGSHASISIRLYFPRIRFLEALPVFNIQPNHSLLVSKVLITMGPHLFFKFRLNRKAMPLPW